MQINVETINPAVAASILGNSHQNRNVRGNYVKLLSREMRSGNWQVTGQPIIISDQGQLLDGQHRLRAIIDSGESINIAVARGVPTASVHCIDTGRARTPGDVLAMRGVKGANQYAAVAQRVAYMLVDNRDRVAARDDARGRIPTSALPSFVKTLDGEYLAEVMSLAITTTRRFPLANTTTLAALGYVAGPGLHEKYSEFCNMVATGEGLSADSPAIALRNWLIKGGTRRAMTRDGRVYAHSRAWAAFLCGERITKIVYKPSRPGNSGVFVGDGMESSKAWLAQYFGEDEND